MKVPSTVMDFLIFMYGSITTLMSSINIATSIATLSMFGQVSFAIKPLAHTFCQSVSLGMFTESFLKKFFQIYWTMCHCVFAENFGFNTIELRHIML